MRSFSIKKITRIVGTCFFVCVSPFDSHAADYGEWCDVKNRAFSNEDVRRWVTVRESSRAYRVKSGIDEGVKPDGNILVAEIEKIEDSSSELMTIRSSMYPFGQINRSYDSVDLADVLLEKKDSVKLKTSVFIYNKLCVLATKLDIIKKKHSREKVYEILEVKQDLEQYQDDVRKYVGKDFAEAVNAISNKNLVVPNLNREIKSLRSEIKTLLAKYIATLRDVYFPCIGDIIGNDLIMGNEDGKVISAPSISQRRMDGILQMYNNNESYDKIHRELKSSNRFRDNAHRLVHSEDILLYCMRKKFPHYKLSLVCSYMDMCKDCELVVCRSLKNNKHSANLVVVSEKENPKEQNDDKRSTKGSAVKKVRV